jgi:ribosome modulation factor
MTDYQEGYAKGHYEFSQKNASTPAPPPPAPAATGSDSASYQRGYQDGVSGEDSNPGPIDSDSMTDYQEGYAKGHYDSQKNATNEQAYAAHQKGYEDGLSFADADPIGRVGMQYAQDYTSGYNAGKADRPSHSPNTNPPNSEAWLIKEIEDLGGDCYVEGAISYDDLKQKYEELKQRKTPDNGPRLEKGKPIKREEDAEDPRREFRDHLKDEPPPEVEIPEIVGE